MEFEPNQDGLLIVSRHGKKKKVKGVAPASEGDKKLVHLSEEGAKEIAEMGKLLLGENEFAQAVSKYSDFQRTYETTLTILNQAVKGGIPKVDMEGRMNLGFGIPGLDWFGEGSPYQGPIARKENLEDPVVLSKIIQRAYTDWYLSGSEKQPCMSKFSNSLLTGIVDTVQQLQSGYKAGTKSLGTVITHSPLIDAATMFLLDVIDVEGGRVKFDEAAFAKVGAFGQGQYATAKLSALGSENPTLEFDLKGLQKGYKLSDLVKKKEEVYAHTQVTPK